MLLCGVHAEEAALSEPTSMEHQNVVTEVARVSEIATTRAEDRHKRRRQARSSERAGRKKAARSKIVLGG